MLCYELAEPSQALQQTFTSLPLITTAYTPPFFTPIDRQLPMKNLNSFLNYLHISTSLKWQIPENTVPVTHSLIMLFAISRATMQQVFLSGAFTHWDFFYTTDP